jgi:hypothetical protein
MAHARFHVFIVRLLDDPGQTFAGIGLVVLRRSEIRKKVMDWDGGEYNFDFVKQKILPVSGDWQRT